MPIYFRVSGGLLWMTDISRTLETQWRMSMSRLILSIANVYYVLPDQSQNEYMNKLVISCFEILVR